MECAFKPRLGQGVGVLPVVLSVQVEKKSCIQVSLTVANKICDLESK